MGSSNFTRSGLTKNVELNIQVQSGREVAQLQDWFDEHWQEGKDITEDITLRSIRGRTLRSRSMRRLCMSSSRVMK